MRLFCARCNTDAEITIHHRTQPGVKASCALCGRYIKFLNREERLEAEGGPRPAREDVLAIAQRLRHEDQQWLKEQLTDSAPATPKPPKLKKKEGFGRPYKNILPPLKKK